VSQILGLCGIVFSLWFVLKNTGGGFKGYYDLPSLVLLVVMPPSVMMLSHTLSDLFMGFKLLFSAMFSKQRRQQRDIIEALTQAGAMVRSEGLGALMKVKERAQYELLRDGLALILNDFKTEEIRHNLTARINAKQSHMQSAASLFENMSKVCPGVGMLGTLMGLIAMLANMEDPAKINSGLALSMITTLYGLLLGTVIYGPWSEKVALEAEKSLETDMLVLEGVLNIKGKKSSIHMKDIMKTYGGAKTGATPQKVG